MLRDDWIMILMFVFVAMFASTAMAFQETHYSQTTPTEAVVLFDNVVLRSACAVGAVLGALLSILIYPGKYRDEEVSRARREMAAKFLASMVSGVLATPIVIRWSGIPVDLDHVVAVAGFVSFVAVTILHKALPMIETKLGNRIEKFTTWMFGE